MSCAEVHDTVIVGGGICGLATALALHRKGLRSLVLERSETSQAAGLAIGVHSNGWRALDQLGVGGELRHKAARLTGIRDLVVGSDAKRDMSYGKEELRCLKRSDLIKALAENLPSGAIRFGCQIVAIGEDSVTSFPTVHLQDGRVITAKVLIGCDGINSIISKSLGLEDPKCFSISVMRGFTYFPDGHDLENTFVRMRGDRVFCGILPIDDKIVHWFVSWMLSREPDLKPSQDPEYLRNAAQNMLKGFPEEAIRLVRDSDASSLLVSRLRYRAPWSLLTGQLWKGTTTVAGDAMHVMGPFLGQGGCSSLEDAIVLARNLAAEMEGGQVGQMDDQQMRRRAGSALEKYVKERKLRVLRLCTQTYLTGMMLEVSSKVVQLLILFMLVVFFGSNSNGHVKYDCGRL